MRNIQITTTFEGLHTPYVTRFKYQGGMSAHLILKEAVELHDFPNIGIAAPVSLVIEEYTEPKHDENLGKRFRADEGEGAVFILIPDIDPASPHGSVGKGSDTNWRRFYVDGKSYRVSKNDALRFIDNGQWVEEVE